MKKYEISFTHVINRYVSCIVEADNEEEALEKAKCCEWLDSDEENAPEDGIESKDYEIIGEL